MLFQLADAQQLGAKRLFVERVAVPGVIAMTGSLSAENAAYGPDGGG
jgi:hypothetical protein